jgi:hypothetical protein
MKYSSSKEINKCIVDLIKAGWHPIKKSKHWQIKSPTARVLMVPSTPSDRRAVLNFKSDLRRIS